MSSDHRSWLLAAPWARFRVCSSSLAPAALLALLVPFGVACGDKDGSDTGSAATGATAADFDESEQLAHRLIDDDGTCDYGWYWPALSTASPLFVVRYDAPEPPYEIRSLTAAVRSNDAGFGSLDCNASKALRVFAYVDTAETPMALLPETNEAWPSLTVLAEVELVGVGDGAVEIELLSAELEEPVRVESAGYLYVGYEVLEEGVARIACPAGCAQASDVLGGKGAEITAWSYQPENNDWGEDAGWSEYEESPDLRVTVGF